MWFSAIFAASSVRIRSQDVSKTSLKHSVLGQGVHVLLLSLACCPVMWVFCSLYSFYMGTLTWYNIFIHYNEQRTCCHTVRYPSLTRIRICNGAAGSGSFRLNWVRSWILFDMIFWCWFFRCCESGMKSFRTRLRLFSVLDPDPTYFN